MLKTRCNGNFQCNDFYNELESYKLNGQVNASGGFWKSINNFD